MDIENKELLLKYLSSVHGIEVHESDVFEILRDGVSNKAILYSGSAGNWVIKQALKKLRVEADWFSSPERLKVEAMAIQWLNSFLPDESVPNLIFFDEENYILAMDAIEQPHSNFKHLLLRGEVKKDLICQMARLLATIHNQGVEDSAGKSTFGNRSFFKDLRIEPYYKYTASALPETSEFYNQLIEDSLATRTTVVHGDYSPKNILVRDETLVLLDHEVMHWGDPTFDIGFALCHLLSKANHLNDTRFKKAASMFWEEYSSLYSHQDANFENRATRQLMGCLLARVYGRSPLEYLNKQSQGLQVKAVLELIKEETFFMVPFIESFSKRVINN